MDQNKKQYIHSFPNKPEVVIRTNSTETALTINAENDTVKHYDAVGQLTITAVDPDDCYYENGFVAELVSFGTGKFVVCETAQFHQTMDAVRRVFQENKGTNEAPDWQFKDGIAYEEGTAPQYAQHKWDENGVCEYGHCTGGANGGKAVNDKHVHDFTNGDCPCGEATPSQVSVTKGSKISLDTDNNGTTGEYLVISVDGNNAELWAKESIANKCWYDTGMGETANVLGVDFVKYFGSDLDTYLESTWYAGLDEGVKGAIVNKSITQYAYKHNNASEDDALIKYPGYELDSNVPADILATDDIGTVKYYLNYYGEVETASRHAYLLDAKDVLAYIGCNDEESTKLNFKNIITMFDLDGTENFWLRSANDDYNANMVTYFGRVSELFAVMDLGSAEVRPAFTIDLSKLTLTDEGMGTYSTVVK